MRGTQMYSSDFNWPPPETPLVDPYEPKEPPVPKRLSQFFIWFFGVLGAILLIHAWTWHPGIPEKYRLLRPVDQLEQDYQMIRNAYINGGLPDQTIGGEDSK